MAVDFVGIQTAVQHLNRIFQLNNHDFNQTAISAFKRSGHARFRRAPPPSSSSDPLTPSVSSRFEETNATAASNDCYLKKTLTDATATASLQSLTSSLASSFAEGSVSNGRQLSSLGIVAPVPSFSSRKPPLPSSHRKRYSTDIASSSLHRSGREKNHSFTGCHCCKKRKIGSKREVRRIPITGSKVDSIPADDYSWKKYGEKKVAGSRFPRVYYKCNSVKGCPARKCIELAVTDSKMLIVTYDREHRH
ncbi:hypothetical protein QVD17_26221 [Tagetes erecta]|uniref:WRKY domain-containing protein n=1 Tax=Tagetes erecta TaxID=13708 RepID=A0AAD8K666_TARER|nr:hypothetical protein QVD17_26221 [Tagetes erecta]